MDLEEKTGWSVVTRESFLSLKPEKVLKRGMRCVMPYKLSGREVGTILLAIYEHYHHIADQLHDPSHPFQFDTLESWHRSGLVAREVTPSFFTYFDRKGQKHPFNLFVFGRLHKAIDKGGDTFEEIFETAVYAPLLKPDTFAMRVAEMNIKDYLMAMGGSDLIRHQFTILDMLLAYHRHELHPMACNGEFFTRKTVNTWNGFASELSSRLGHGFDWQVIAHFLIEDTVKQGKGAEILSKYGNVRVYKSVSNTTCDACKALYQDGDYPKLFYIKDLLQNGPATIARRIGENAGSVPTCGPSHQWCNCSGPNLLTGYESWHKEESPTTPQMPIYKSKEPNCLIELTRNFFNRFKK